MNRRQRKHRKTVKLQIYWKKFSKTIERLNSLYTHPGVIKPEEVARRVINTVEEMSNSKTLEALASISNDKERLETDV